MGKFTCAHVYYGSLCSNTVKIEALDWLATLVLGHTNTEFWARPMFFLLCYVFPLVCQRNITELLNCRLSAGEQSD